MCNVGATRFVAICHGGDRTGVRVGIPVTPESLSREGPRAAFCCHRKRTHQKGAWICLRVSTAPLGSEDKPASVKRQSVTLLLRTPFTCPGQQRLSARRGPPRLPIRCDDERTRSACGGLNNSWRTHLTEAAEGGELNWVRPAGR